jgi:predicted RecA/RadA family phage recombinase
MTLGNAVPFNGDQSMLQTAPVGGVVAGTIYFINSRGFVARETIAGGVTGSFVYAGPVLITKTGGNSFIFGAPVYCDVVTGLATSVSGGNILVGAAIVAAAGGDSSVHVNFDVSSGGPFGTSSSAQGRPGLDGSDGEDGLTIIGPIGPAGTAGATGATGIGIPGMNGEDGADAIIIPGPAGATGATGPAGSGGGGTQVIPGMDGEDGADAPIIPGPRGAAGADGGAGGLTLGKAVARINYAGIP